MDLDPKVKVELCDVCREPVVPRALREVGHQASWGGALSWHF